MVNAKESYGAYNYKEKEKYIHMSTKQYVKYKMYASHLKKSRSNIRMAFTFFFFFGVGKGSCSRD